MKKEKNKEFCNHKFELARIESTTQNQSSAGANYFYQKIGYVVC